MKKFEYYSFFETKQDTIDQTLDELGNQGWEAFAVVPTVVGVVVYLKREKP